MTPIWWPVCPRKGFPVNPDIRCFAEKKPCKHRNTWLTRGKLTWTCEEPGEKALNRRNHVGK